MALTVLAGQIILADDHNALIPKTAAKASATSRASTTVLTADPHLVLSLPVGTFDLRGNLLIASAADAAGDFSHRWSWTGTMTVTMGGIGPTNLLASGATSDADFVRQLPDSASPSAVSSYGASNFGVNAAIDVRVVVTVAGNLTLEWAQLASNANATTLEAGSWITAYPVA